MNKLYFGDNLKDETADLRNYQKIQILTIEGLLKGTMRPDYPDTSLGALKHKRAQVEKNKGQEGMFYPRCQPWVYCFIQSPIGWHITECGERVTPTRFCFFIILPRADALGYKYIVPTGL